MPVSSSGVANVRPIVNSPAGTKTMPAGASAAGTGRASAAAGHSQLAASANISRPWHKSRGGVTRPGAEGVTRGRSGNAAPRSPCSRPEGTRNPSGDGHFCSAGGADVAAHRDRAFSSQRPPRSSALSFVGGDRPGPPSSSLRAERPQEPAAPSTGLVPRAARSATSRRRVFKRTAPRFRRRYKARWRRAGRRIGRPAWKACWSLP